MNMFEIYNDYGLEFVKETDDGRVTVKTTLADHEYTFDIDPTMLAYFEGNKKLINKHIMTRLSAAALTSGKNFVRKELKLLLEEQ